MLPDTRIVAAISPQTASSESHSDCQSRRHLLVLNMLTWFRSRCPREEQTSIWNSFSNLCDVGCPAKQQKNLKFILFNMVPPQILTVGQLNNCKILALMLTFTGCSMRVDIP